MKTEQRTSPNRIQAWWRFDVLDCFADPAASELRAIADGHHHSGKNYCATGYGQNATFPGLKSPR